MDVQAIINAIMEQAKNAPEVLQNLASDPAGTIESITGAQLDASAISEVVQGVANQAQESGFDIASILEGAGLGDIVSNLTGNANIGDAVSGILGGSGNDIASGVSDLLGGILGKK